MIFLKIRKFPQKVSYLGPQFGENSPRPSLNFPAEKRHTVRKIYNSKSQTFKLGALIRHFKNSRSPCPPKLSEMKFRLL